MPKTQRQPTGTKPMAATPQAIAAAKRYVLAQWQARHRDRGGAEPPPSDLSSACKFANQFAAAVFGGSVQGNFFHQWATLADATKVDLCADAADVAALSRGEIPEYAQAYARGSFRTPPKPLYAHDRKHKAHRDTKESNLSCRPRVEAWVADFTNGAARALTPG